MSSSTTDNNSPSPGTDNPSPEQLSEGHPLEQTGSTTEESLEPSDQHQIQEANTVDSPQPETPIKSSKSSMGIRKPAHPQPQSLQKRKPHPYLRNFETPQESKSEKKRKKLQEVQRQKELEEKWTPLRAPVNERPLDKYNPLLAKDCPILGSPVFQHSILHNMKQDLTEKEMNSLRQFKQMREQKEK